MGVTSGPYLALVLAGVLLGWPPIDSALAQTNRAPTFADATTTREIAEGAVAGARVGAKVTATDKDTKRRNDSLTYSLETTPTAPDAESFTINPNTGRIKVKAGTTLDHEHWKNVYWVVVKATDTGGESATIEVTIRVTDVEETLDSLAGPTTASHPENKAARVATYLAYTDTATKNRTGEVEWSLSGADAGQFTITDGVLRFKTPPDYENPTDEGTDNAYDNAYAVTVTATDEATPTANTRSKDVVVSVTDVDEPGKLTLSSTRPKLDTANMANTVALTATIADPDGAVVETPTWQWERSAGRTAWQVIAGATSGSYTPGAADAGHFLRVTATYVDKHGGGKTVQATTKEVVIAYTLRSLSLQPTPLRAMYPAFDPDTLHYAVGCETHLPKIDLTLDTTEANTRVAVNGVQHPKGEKRTVSGQPGDAYAEFSIVLTGPDGASTTYVIHCLNSDLPEIEVTREAEATGIIEDLMMFSTYPSLVVMDNNGVPRWYDNVAADTARNHAKGRTVGPFFRPFRFSEPGENGLTTHTRKYMYSIPATDAGEHGSQLIMLDDDFALERKGIYTVGDLTVTDAHDFSILKNGNYVVLSYEPAQRNFRFLTEKYQLRTGGKTNAKTNTPLYRGKLTEDPSDAWKAGQAWPTNQDTDDSVVQVRTHDDDGNAVWTWYTWQNTPIEDCLGHRFARDYSHISSLGRAADGDFIPGLRGCSSVLRVNYNPGGVDDKRIVWRAGRSNHSRAAWEAGRTSGSGPAPLAFVNDPEGEFCAQHAATLNRHGNLMMYDNGVACVPDPLTGESQRMSRQFSRAVEYEIDTENNELIFLRHHSLGGDAVNIVGYASGHVELLDNDDWLISWGRTPVDRIGCNPPGVGLPYDSATQIAPDGTEKFRIDIVTKGPPPESNKDCAWVDAAKTVLPSAQVRAIPLSPAALAAKVEPLTAEIITDSTAASSDRPTVVVAFNQPVVDPTTDTPSISVSGATVAKVSHHTEDGQPANAYIFTLKPSRGNDSITFRLVANKPCTDSGICTAGGTVLSSVPKAHEIPRSDSRQASEQSPPAAEGGGGGGGGGRGGRDRHGNTPAQATPVRLRTTAPWRSSTPGEINTFRDRDYFRLSVPHAGILVVETTGTTDTVGTVWQAGDELGTATGGGPRTNFRLRVPVAAGPVVIAVTGNRGRTGRYSLRTRLLVGVLENPAPRSFQSGIGVISGWVCAAEVVEIELNGQRQPAAIGTARADTAPTCGHSATGFGLLFNWNLLGDGEHTVVAFVDDIELARATVTVTTLGAEVVDDAEGTCEVADFPSVGESVTVAWQASSQNFVITEGTAPTAATQAGRPGVGMLENPRANAYQSGIGLISGWVCDAERVEIVFNAGPPQAAGYGTARADTVLACGDADNGFGLLFNWNLLGDGEHTVAALVDGAELGRAVVRVTTLGEELVEDAEGECVVEDFPGAGETVTLRWQPGRQNFGIVAYEAATASP